MENPGINEVELIQKLPDDRSERDHMPDIDETDDILCANVFEDLINAFFKARVAAPIVSVVLFMLTYQLTIMPYSRSNNLPIEKQMASMDSLKLVRPILDKDVMHKIKERTMYAETSFWMPSYDVISVRFFTTVSQAGNFQPPQLFYGM